MLHNFYEANDEYLDSARFIEKIVDETINVLCEKAGFEKIKKTYHEQEKGNINSPETVLLNGRSITDADTFSDAQHTILNKYDSVIESQKSIKLSPTPTPCLEEVVATTNRKKKKMKRKTKLLATEMAATPIQRTKEVSQPRDVIESTPKSLQPRTHPLPRISVSENANTTDVREARNMSKLSRTPALEALPSNPDGSGDGEVPRLRRTVAQLEDRASSLLAENRELQAVVASQAVRIARLEQRRERGLSARGERPPVGRPPRGVEEAGSAAGGQRSVFAEPSLESEPAETVQRLQRVVEAQRGQMKTQAAALQAEVAAGLVRQQQLEAELEQQEHESREQLQCLRRLKEAFLHLQQDFLQLQASSLIYSRALRSSAQLPKPPKSPPPVLSSTFFITSAAPSDCASAPLPQPRRPPPRAASAGCSRTGLGRPRPGQLADPPSSSTSRSDAGD